MKGQFQSTEALKIRFQPFINTATGAEITGDACTIKVKTPGGTETDYTSVTSPAVSYDSTMGIWKLDIPTGSYAAGEWMVKATSNNPAHIPQRKIFYWGDWVEQVAGIKAKTDNLPSDPADQSLLIAAISAVETKVDTVDTVVDAVKVKTDALPTDPADQSLVIAATDAIYNRIGAPVGTSISDDISNVSTGGTDITDLETAVDAIKAKTDNLPSDPADQSLVIAATDAIYTRLGAPAGASIADDISNVSGGGGGDLTPVQVVVDAIKLKTDNLPSDPADQSLLIAAISAVETKVDTVDTVVGAVKVKTDALPSDPADQSLLITAISAVETKVDIVDTVVDAIKLKTDNLPANPASQTNLDVAVSTRAAPSDVTTAVSGLATAVNLAAAKTVVDAVKLKTDNLPASPAAVSDVTSARDAVRGASSRDNTQIYERLGAPAGASLAADIANIDLGDLPSDVATISSKVADLHKERFNRWKVQGTQLLIYEDDGTTLFQVFNMKDEDGLPSATRVFERVPV